MKFALYDNWRVILKEAWSLRFIALSGICSFIQAFILPIYQDYLSPYLFAGLSGFFLCAAFVSRLVSQKDI